MIQTILIYVGAGALALGAICLFGWGVGVFFQEFDHPPAKPSEPQRHRDTEEGK